jgi:hypothetical protein
MPNPGWGKRRAQLPQLGNPIAGLLIRRILHHGGEVVIPKVHRSEGRPVGQMTAAMNPQLKMKLENMPIPMTADMIDAYMGPILEAGKTGDLGLIRMALP